MASIHSSVSTSLAVRSQSTAGTRKSGSSLVFSAISESAAASRRKSISTMTERAQRVDDLDEPQPPRLGGEVLGVARDEGEGAQVGAEAALDAGPQHLDRDRRAIRSPSRPPRDAPARSRRRRPAAPKMREHRVDRPAERGRDHRFRLALRKRRHLVLQPFEIAGERRADDIRPRRQELAELDVARPEPGQRRRQPRFRAAAGRRARSGARARSSGRAGAGTIAGSTTPNTPSRANTKPARPRRTRCAGPEITNASRNAAPRCRRSSR